MIGITFMLIRCILPALLLLLRWTHQTEFRTPKHNTRYQQAESNMQPQRNACMFRLLELEVQHDAEDAQQKEDDDVHHSTVGDGPVRAQKTNQIQATRAFSRLHVHARQHGQLFHVARQD